MCYIGHLLRTRSSFLTSFTPLSVETIPIVVALVILLVKIGWVGVTAVALGAPIEALREFAVVNDEGVMKSNLLGRQTRLEWGEITRVYINPGDNKVVLSGNTKTKVELSLCYNGWQDFVSISAKHLNPMLHLELVFNLAQAGVHKA